MHEGITIGGAYAEVRPSDELLAVTLRLLTATTESQRLQIAALKQDIANRDRRLDYVTTLAFTDPLTKVGTRRRGDDLYSELTQNRTHQRSNELHIPPDGHSVMVIDVDHFKEVNDSYGHAFGDRVLRTIARRAKRNTRRTDHVIRYGGDEFVVMTPATEPEAADKVANKIRRSVSTITEVSGTELTLSVSIGVGRLLVGRELLDGIAEADAALYEAKRNGRNQSVVYNSSMPAAASRQV